MVNENAIIVENLTKVYQLQKPRVLENGSITHELKALDSVCFEIKKGESVGIIGPNGSGKSTLLKLLAGVAKPTSGKITIHGRVASILDIGAGFHPELSGRENVFLNGQIHGFSRKKIQKKFDEIVAFSGIENFIDEPIKNYSNGMYLRLAFSIIVHLDFDIYLLDEVLGIGDKDFRIKCQNILFELTKVHKKTVLMISHNIYEISLFCSKCIYITDGLILEEDKTESVIHNYFKRINNKKRTKQKPLYVKNVKIEFFNKSMVQQSFFLNNESLIIKVKNDLINLDNNSLKFAVRIKDQYDHTLFNISPFFTKKGFENIAFETKGLFCVKIPSFTFNEGEYKIDLIYFNQNEILDEIFDVTTFTIKLIEIHDHPALGKKGAFKPFYDWFID